jgi:ABC-type multidrug transport system ATPase subunit
MLTGDVRITSGKAKVCGHDVETNLDSARKHFGYCPQEDGLDPLLDAYELLRIYGRLRGMSEQETEAAVGKLVQTLGLSKCARRRSGTYSGGNKRKLSTAIVCCRNI